MTHIAKGLHQCPICGVEHAHNMEILLHKQLKDIEDKVIGYGLCEEHDKQEKDGFIFFIEIEDPEDPTRDKLKPEEANRTGLIMFLKRELANDLFDTEPELINFCTKDLTTLLQNMSERNESKGE